MSDPGGFTHPERVAPCRGEHGKGQTTGLFCPFLRRQNDKGRVPPAAGWRASQRLMVPSSPCAAAGRCSAISASAVLDVPCAAAGLLRCSLHIGRARTPTPQPVYGPVSPRAGFPIALETHVRHFGRVRCPRVPQPVRCGANDTSAALDAPGALSARGNGQTTAPRTHSCGAKTTRDSCRPKLGGEPELGVVARTPQKCLLVCCGPVPLRPCRARSVLPPFTLARVPQPVRCGARDTLAALEAPVGRSRSVAVPTTLRPR